MTTVAEWISVHGTVIVGAFTGIAVLVSFVIAYRPRKPKRDTDDVER